jgi:hypothetical protein
MDTLRRMNLDHSIWFDDPNLARCSGHPDGIRRNLNGGMDTYLSVAIDTPESGWHPHSTFARRVARGQQSHHPGGDYRGDENGSQRKRSYVQHRRVRIVH